MCIVTGCIKSSYRHHNTCRKHYDFLNVNFGVSVETIGDCIVDGCKKTALIGGKCTVHGGRLPEKSSGLLRGSGCRGWGYLTKYLTSPTTRIKNIIDSEK